MILEVSFVDIGCFNTAPSEVISLNETPSEVVPTGIAPLEVRGKKGEICGIGCAIVGICGRESRCKMCANLMTA